MAIFPILKDANIFISALSAEMKIVFLCALRAFAVKKNLSAPMRLEESI